MKRPPFGRRQWRRSMRLLNRSAGRMPGFDRTAVRLLPVKQRWEPFAPCVLKATTREPAAHAERGYLICGPCFATRRAMTTARISELERKTTQSGKANSGRWLLEF